MFLAVVGLFEDDKGVKRIRYQRVPHDDRFKDSPEMRSLFAKYQAQLKDIGLEGLGCVANLIPRTTFRRFGNLW